MAERVERAVIRRLIERCRDSERGFLTAAAEVPDPGLQARLERLATERHQFAEQLLPHAHHLGIAITSVGSRAAVPHRGWLLLRADLAVEHDRAILTEAARGERYAAAAYDHAAANLVFPPTRELVSVQATSIRSTRDELAATVQESAV